MAGTGPFDPIWYPLNWSFGGWLVERGGVPPANRLRQPGGKRVYTDAGSGAKWKSRFAGRIRQGNWMDWLMWAPLFSASLHMSEEFVVPGGFLGWYRGYRADPSRMNRRFVAIINAVLLVVCCNIALLGRTSLGIAYWLAISALLCSNGVWHLWASYKSHTYSPGVVTGVLLYVPLAAYGYTQFLRTGSVSIGTAALAGVIGGSYQLWDAAYHGRLRKKAAE
jgi:hypothetical protein